jgi:sugar phosphate isomerase/epimerase
MIYMHSYTYRGYPLELALRKAVQYGYEGIELSGVHHDGKDIRDAIPAAVKIASRFGVPVAVVDVGGNTDSEDEKVRREAIKTIIDVAEIASANGIKMLNGCAGSAVGSEPGDYGKNGSAIATEGQYERAAESFKEIAESLAKFGVLFTFEIHMNTLHDTIKSSEKLLDMIGSPFVKANLDPGNMHGTSTAEPPAEAFAKLGDKLGFCHLKNCRWIGGKPDYTWKLADGEVDMYRLFQSAVASNFAGPFCIEYCGAGDPEAAVRRDIAYVRNALADVLR